MKQFPPGKRRYLPYSGRKTKTSDTSEEEEKENPERKRNKTKEENQNNEDINNRKSRSAGRPFFSVFLLS